MAATRFPPFPACPWLVFNHGEKEGYSTQTFFNVAQNRYNVANIPEMFNKLICTSSHGWLVLADVESDECFLLNPVSMEKIMLPPWPQGFRFQLCIVPSPPTDPNFVVIFQSVDSQSVIFSRLGQSEWTERNLRHKTEQFDDAAACGGKIYGRTLSGSLLRLDVVGSNLILTQLGAEKKPSSSIPGTLRVDHCLVDSCGELFFVVKSYFGRAAKKVRGVEVYRMDFPNLAWEKVESLGNRAFFLSQCNNFSSLALQQRERGSNRTASTF